MNSATTPLVRLLALGLGLTMSLASCSDDDDGDDTGTAGAGRAGSTGKAGTAGRGGNAGTSGGNAGGKAGSSGNGGKAGSGGKAGAGGRAGASGAQNGGKGQAAGAAGEQSAGQGGAAGEAGAGGEGGTAGRTSGNGGEGNTAGSDRDVFRPAERPFTEERFEELRVAEGFEINVYAQSLAQARMLATHENHVYLTRPLQGDVLRFIDADENGVAEDTATAASDLANVHGIAFSGTSVFLATEKQVLRGTVDENGDFAGLSPILDDLPDGGQHPYRTLAIGPDSMLYASVGSSCDACEETNPEHATILRAGLDGSGRAIFAKGLRNTIGFGFHPDTGVLWGMDQGSDWRGNDLPPEELNRIQSGLDYGWPYCFGPARIDPIIEDPPGTTKALYCAGTEPAALEVPAHNSPIGFTFYAASAFPSEYQGDAFIALHGSWNRFPPGGYKVVRLHFDGGEPVGFEDFVSGFLIEDGSAQFGRPAGVTVAPDGALLFSDDSNGIVYRVAATTG